MGIFEEANKDLMELKGTNITVDRETVYLANYLGKILVIIEWGIAKGDFDIPKAQSNIMLGLSQSISANLKQLNKSVKPRFIKRRMEKIIAENPKLIMPKKILIATIAAQFI